MKRSQTSDPGILPYLIIATSIIISCYAFFFLDHETKLISDLFTMGIFVLVCIYFTPTFVFSSLLYSKFVKKRESMQSIILSILIGVPLTFGIIVMLFYLMKP